GRALGVEHPAKTGLSQRNRRGGEEEGEVAITAAEAQYGRVNHANGPLAAPPLGPAVYPRTVAPNRRPYRTKDGYIAALIYNDKQWASFIDAVRPPWAGEHLATVERRARQIDTVYARLADVFKERSTQEWLELLRWLGSPASP